MRPMAEVRCIGAKLVPTMLQGRWRLSLLNDQGAIDERDASRIHRGVSVA